MTDQLAVAFLGTFESLRMGPTFARGRRDERAGHVRQLTVSGSLAVALVRGPEDPTAFRARIAIRAFGAAEWARVEQDLAAQARYAADLLAGRMPAGLPELFAAAGLGLVPLSLDEVAMDCTCERWPMPCVHLAATCYALARSFEEDPFAVFAWRGRPRDELLLRLREARAAEAVRRVGAAAGGSGTAATSGSAEGELGWSGGVAADRRVESDGVAADRRVESDGVAAGGRVGSDGDGSAGLRSVGSDGHDGGGLGGSDRAGGGVSGAGDIDEVAAFWGMGAAPRIPPGGRPGAPSRPDGLLDQLDPPPLAHQGRPIVDLLRPAYRVLPDD